VQMSSFWVTVTGFTVTTIFRISATLYALQVPIFKLVENSTNILTIKFMVLAKSVIFFWARINDQVFMPLWGVVLTTSPL